MTSIIVTETLIKPNKWQNIDALNSVIINLLLVHFSIPNHNAFLRAIIHYLVHNNIINMNIATASKCSRICNRRNRFINSFKGGKSLCTLVDSTIFNICNCLKNFFLEFLKQTRFFKDKSDGIHKCIYSTFDLAILLKCIWCRRLLMYTSSLKPYIKFIAFKLFS